MRAVRWGGAPRSALRRGLPLSTLLAVGALLACGSADAGDGGRAAGTAATEADAAGNVARESAATRRARQAAVPETGRERGREARTETGQEAGGTRDSVVLASSSDLTLLDVAGHPVRAEVADTPEERERGLMYRDSLPDDRGMLFVYPEERTLSFWMRNTRIPLDVAYLDRHGRIVDVQTMEPFTETLHDSRAPAMYALEMRGGWFEDHGVEIGDRVRF